MLLLRTVAVCLPVVLAGILYHSTFAWLYERYTAADTYYSHGFLVPFIAGYLIWLKKGELGRLAVKYSPWGLYLIVAALLLHLLSMAAGVNFISGYSLLMLAFGVSLYFFGAAITRAIAFPLGFLFFMLPLPLSAINAVSFPLRMYATKIAVHALQFAGMPVQNEGFRILFPGDSLIVGNPCSGLRSLMAMLAMASVFAHLSKTGTAKRALLVAAAVPIALLSNVTRLMTLCLGAFKYGSNSIQGLFHDATGYLAFAVAFGLLWYAWRELGNVQGGPHGKV